MPARRTSKRWEHPHLRYAYVREYRGLACTVVRGGPPISTGLKWHPSAKAEALRILEARYYGRTVLPEPEQTGGAYCADAFNRFKKERFPQLSRSICLQITRAFTRLVPADLPLNDHLAIRDAILERIKREPWAPNTRRSIMKRLREVFAFAIAEGMMAQNPIRADLIPKEELSTPEGYSDAEFESMRAHLTGRHRAFIEILHYGGLRPVEVLRITEADIHADHLVVHGKQTRRAHLNDRIIPFKLCPGLEEALRAAVETGVLELRSYLHVQDALRAACETAGIEYRGLYPFRYGAVSRWTRQGWDERVMEAVAGHSREVSRKHYRAPWSASELVEMVTETR